MSHCRVVVVDEPIKKLDVWHSIPFESRTTEYRNKIHWQVGRAKVDGVKSLLCWSVLVPHMVGEPKRPGEVMENWSVVQSPVAPSGNTISKILFECGKETKDTPTWGTSSCGRIGSGRHSHLSSQCVCLKPKFQVNAYGRCKGILLWNRIGYGKYPDCKGKFCRCRG